MPCEKLSDTLMSTYQHLGLWLAEKSLDVVEIACCSRSYLENQMAVALGGRVAEELIFGEDDVTTGASGDFQQVCHCDMDAFQFADHAAESHLSAILRAASK